MRVRALVVPILVAASCGPSALISVGASATNPSVSTQNPALQLLMRSSVPEPLGLGGTRVAYSGLVQALTQDVSAAAEPWVARHGNSGPGWQLLIELVKGDAGYHRGRATVNLALRATLRTQVGNEHLSQTQAHCQRTAEVAATEAGSVFQSCLADLGTELSRWLGGIEP
jgi:hypothetical protein